MFRTLQRYTKTTTLLRATIFSTMLLSEGCMAKEAIQAREQIILEKPMVGKFVGDCTKAKKEEECKRILAETCKGKDCVLCKDKYPGIIEEIAQNPLGLDKNEMTGATVKELTEQNKNNSSGKIIVLTILGTLISSVFLISVVRVILNRLKPRPTDKVGELIRELFRQGQD